MHPHDPLHGVTLYCANRDCTAQDVSAGGRDEAKAYEVIREKYIRPKP
jgi:hypothetical protein